MMIRGGTVPPWTVAAGALLLSFLFLLPTGAAAPLTSTIPPSLASYNTGRVSVVLPGALPAIILYQDANNSVSASLEVQEVLELAPGAGPHPTVVAAAFPNAVQGFNGTTVPTSSHWPLTLSANLSVRRQNISLWTAAPTIQPAGLSIGASTLSVQYAPLDNGSPAAGVAVQWTIQNWPWVAAGDLLAVEMRLAVSPAGALAVCAGAAPVGLSLPPCAGPTLSDSLISWGSSFDGLEGTDPQGPVATVSWNSNSSGLSTPYTMGAYSDGDGSAQIVLGASAQGATTFTGGVGFAIAAPLGPVAAKILGIGWVYGGTVLLTTAVAVGGIVAYRRRERRVKDEL